MTDTADDTDLGEVARPAAARADGAELAAALGPWLTGVLGAAADPRIEQVTVPTAGGMSSDTVLVDAAWTEGGDRRTHRLVARLAPTADAMPVFPHYDLGLQAEVMRLVGERTAVPVPTVYWHEPSPAALGREFLVIERIDGQIPPDVMPYDFEGWVFDATAEQRRRLQTGSVTVLADLHAMPRPHLVHPALTAAARSSDGHAPGGPDAPDTRGPVAPVSAREALAAHLAGQRAYFDWAAAGGPRPPLIDRGLDQLAQTLPEVPGEAVLCWGDSRIGNIVYRDFSPVGVLDWEMVTLGPPELDLGWMIFLHRFFEDIAAAASLPGLPDLLRRADVAADYTARTGHAVADLDWFITYAALRQAIIMYRISRRTLAFGAAEAPDDPDQMIVHAPSLAAMLDGTYFTDLAAKGL